MDVNMSTEKNICPQYYCWQNDQLFVDLLVQTYASRDEIVGVQGNRLKVRLAVSPVAGKANEHLLRLLAEYYGVPQNRIHLTKGHQSRMKQICVVNPLNNIPVRN